MDDDLAIHVQNGYDHDAVTYIPVIIVGAGESGIAAGCRLKAKFGFDQFRIYERLSGIGGTWWINRYPGVRCDVPSVFYSFSWAPDFGATSFFPNGRDFVKYLHSVASKFRIVDKVSLNTDVAELRWLEDLGLWEATLIHLAPGMGDLSAAERRARVKADGQDAVFLRTERIRAKAVISCAGGLVEPRAFPENVRGRESFEGTIVHAARWPQDLSLRDKDVVIVGTGCSAAQIVPAILEDATYSPKSVTQLMREAPWVEPKVPEPGGPENFAKYGPMVFRTMPFLGHLLRFYVFIFGERDWFRYFGEAQRTAENRKQRAGQVIGRMESQAPAKYHELLTPSYGYGCKRRIFDPPVGGWYKSMNDERYTLTTQELRALRPRSIALNKNQVGQSQKTTVNDDNDDDLVDIPADVIVLCNGFAATEWLHPLRVVGQGGRDLHAVWAERGGPGAYMGSAVDGFPNLFMIIGPNTLTGHSSVIYQTENMVEFALARMAPLLRGDADRVEVKASAQRDWTDQVQRDVKHTVFTHGGCRSWYIDPKTGFNSVVYPRSQIDATIRYKLATFADWNVTLTKRGLRRQRFRRVFATALFTALLVASLWARRERTGLVPLLKGWLSGAAKRALNAARWAVESVESRV